MGTAPGPPRNPNLSCIAELNGSKSAGRDAGRGPDAKRGSDRRKEGGEESVELRLRLERIPPRPRGGAAEAGSGVRWVGLWQMDRKEPERAVQEHRRAEEKIQKILYI